jgi:hypothetical protein
MSIPDVYRSFGEREAFGRGFHAGESGNG